MWWQPICSTLTIHKNIARIGVDGKSGEINNPGAHKVQSSHAMSDAWARGVLLLVVRQQARRATEGGIGHKARRGSASKLRFLLVISCVPIRK